jgi:hypothetical protein
VDWKHRRDTTKWRSEFKLANISLHQDLFKLVNESALKVLTADPTLEQSQNKGLKPSLHTD